MQCLCRGSGVGFGARVDEHLHELTSAFDASHGPGECFADEEVRLVAQPRHQGRSCGRVTEGPQCQGGALTYVLVRVEGAEPGDTLALHLVDLEPARSWGASSLIPFFGGMTSTDVTMSLQEALPQRTWIYEIDSAAGTVGFIAQSADLQIPLPLSPMLGTVGVAPFLESRTTLTPERFGGNMDTPEMKAGTTVYLGVNVEGAMFSIGDGHYRQGEGEACGTAVEGAMTTTLVVELIKGGAPAWPRLENDTH